MSVADSWQFPVKKQYCSWLCKSALLLKTLNIISDHPWSNTRSNTSTSTTIVTVLPRHWRLCVKLAPENVTKLTDKQGSAWELQVTCKQSSLLISKRLTVIHALFPKQCIISLELKDMALDLVYIIPVSTCAGGGMKHLRWLAVKTFSGNEDDYYSEPSSRSLCLWTWVMLTTWKCSRMDRSEQLCKCEEIALWWEAVARRTPRDRTTARSKAQGRDFFTFKTSFSM